MRKGNVIWGIIFILVGVLLLLKQVYNLEILSMRNLWPFIILFIGLAFEIDYFADRRNPGVLVPGGIFMTIGFLFIFETQTSWAYSGKTWPIYLLAVAIGLLQLFIFGNHERGLLIPISILLIISLIALARNFWADKYSWLNYSFILPCIIIVIGLYILLGNIKRP